jgi:HK97 family phage portal protein
MAEKAHSNKIDMNRYLDAMTGTDEDDQIEQEQKAYDITRDGDPTTTGGLWSEEIAAFADMQTIEALFFSEDWVFIVVDLISQKISSQPLLVMRKIMEGGTERTEYADNHPINDIIAQPNEFQDYHSWMYNYVTQYTLLGNAINWYSKSTKQLVTLRTSQISLDFDAKGSISQYLVMEHNEENPLSVARDKALRFKASEIIHTRRPNPVSLIWGLSPFVAGRKSILFNRFSTDYLNSFYLKQATPGMVLEVGDTVNEAKAIRQLRSFEMAYTGRRNQRRTMILPKGIKATQQTHSIADQRISELVNMNRETILALLKIPKHELGLQDSGSLGSEEYKTALRNFWEATLIPSMRMIEGSLNKFFAPMLGESFFFQFDLDNVEALKDDLMRKTEIAAKMLAAGLSINEIRERIWEVEASSDPKADEPYVLVQQQPSFGQQTLSVSPLQSTEEKAIVEIEDKQIDSAELKLKSIVSSRKSGWLESVTKSLEDIAEGKEGQHFEGVVLETLTSMTDVALPLIRKNLVETKATDIPSKSKLRKDIKNAFDNFEEVWVDEYITTLDSTVELGYDQQLDLIFNAPDKEKIEALRRQTAQGRKQILEARGLESFDQVSKTHTDRIMREIIKGSEKNEPISDIIRRVAETFGKPENMQLKAQMIARTETLTAVSIGQAGLMNNAKEVIPGLRKAWLNVGDDGRVRDTHKDKSQGGVSGEIVGVDEEFSNGLRYPRDLQATDGADVINCRCTLITLPPGEDLNE